MRAQLIGRRRFWPVAQRIYNALHVLSSSGASRTTRRGGPLDIYRKLPPLREILALGRGAMYDGYHAAE